mgnify:CR=1 FL=1
MKNLLGGVRNLFGQVSSAVGSFFNNKTQSSFIPQAGARSSSQQLNYSPTGRPVASSVTGGTIFQQPGGQQNVVPIAPRQAIKQFGQPSSQVLGATTSGGGGQPQGSQLSGDQGQQGFQEQPSGVDTSYVDELLNPAMSALEGLESETRSLLGGGEQQAEAYRGAAEAKATQAKKTGLGQVQTQEAGARTAAEEAEFQQRRGYGEISQQFGGRFGRSGFGQGVLGSIAENTLQTVGRIRTGLQGVVQELNTRRNQLEDIFNSAVQEANSEAENLKQNARGQLQNALSQIGQSRVALQTRKAELVNSALENYRQTVAQVNARNAEFGQQIALNKQQSDLRIQEAQAKANNSLQNLPSFSLSPGETKFIPLTDLGGQEGFDQFSGTQLPGGVQTGTAGQFGVFSSPGKKNLTDVEAQYEELKRSQGINQ